MGLSVASAFAGYQQAVRDRDHKQKPSKAKYYLDDTAEIVRLMQGLA